MKKSITTIKSSGNLFKDVGFDAEESNKLQFRSFLMVALMKYIQNENITQKEAAKRFGVSQSRISHLMHCRIDLFSTDMLLDMMERVGFKVYEKIKIDIAEAINQPWFKSFNIKQARF
jgi:predicted XRE-type DNA-binding protein